MSTEQDSVRRLTEIRLELSKYGELPSEEVDYLLSLIDSLTAERDALQRNFDLVAEVVSYGGALDEMQARAEAAEAEVKRLREALMAHHEAGVLARTVGVETHQAWGMRCPFCAAALATPPSEGGQS